MLPIDVQPHDTVPSGRGFGSVLPAETIDPAESSDLEKYSGPEHSSDLGDSCGSEDACDLEALDDEAASDCSHVTGDTQPEDYAHAEWLEKKRIQYAGSEYGWGFGNEDW